MLLMKALSKNAASLRYRHSLPEETISLAGASSGGRYRIRTRVLASEAPDDIQTTPIAHPLATVSPSSMRRVVGNV